MGYKRETIIKYCEERLKDPSFFYKKDLPGADGKPIERKDIINYRGVCTDTKEYYTEVIAEFLCNHINEFKSGIKTVDRENYKVDGHECEKINTSRTEEGIAMKMRRYSKNGGIYEFIGEIIDYQVPLKSSSKDDGLGKIDLLAYDQKRNTMRILELKKPDSNETMLRCVLEAYTYYAVIKDKKKLAENYGHPDAEVKASPLVFTGKESNPYQEMLQERPWLKKLMKLLDSEPFYIHTYITDKIV